MSKERWLVRNVLEYPCTDCQALIKLMQSFMCCYGKMVQIYSWVENTGYKITYIVSSQFCKKPNHLSTCRLYIYEECSYDCIDVYRYKYECTYIYESNHRYLRV